MTKHLRKGIWALTSNWRAAVCAEDDRARARVKQCRQAFSEFELFLFVEQVEEERGVDRGDAPPQFSQAVDRCDGGWRAGWYRSGGRKVRVIEHVPDQELCGIRLGCGSEQPVSQITESCNAIKM